MQSTLNIGCGLVKADATVTSKPSRPTGLLVYVHTRPEELRYRAAHNRRHQKSDLHDS